MKTTIPDGHEVTVHRVQIDPSVVRTPGGTVIVSFGTSGDDPNRELDGIIAGLDQALAEPGPPVVLAIENGPLDGLFAPAQPKTARTPVLVLWTFHRGAVDLLVASAHRVERVMQCVRRVGGAVYFVDPPPEGLAAQLRELGVAIRKPDNSSEGLAVLLEVKRPDGEVLSALAGDDYPDDATRPSAAPFAYRGPRLRARILELQQSGDTNALVGELRARELPLLMMKAPNSDELQVRKYGPHPALPVYGDLTSLQWAAKDLEKAPDSFDVIQIPPRSVFAMAAEGKLGLAICTYRDRKTPLYAVIPPNAVT